MLLSRARPCTGGTDVIYTMGLLMVLVWSRITAGDGLGDGVVDRQIEGDQRHSPLTIDRLISHDIPTTLNCPSQPITTCSNISDSTICWGYEKGCTKDDRLFLPYCDGPPSPWGKTIDDKMELFWKQGDFGYVKDAVDSLIMLCKPKQKDGASLVCSTNMRYCRAENFYLDLRRFNEFANREGDTYKSFRENIFQLGEVGGYCDLDKRLLNDQGEHKSPLQSWYAELEEYTGLYHDPILMNECDQIVTKPTVFIKLDAGINLYHHYCDFFNLYASQHVNNSFDKDINIVIWDTSYSIYRDLFVETWQAFTSNPVQRLADFAMKRVCFKDVMFPLLARMRGGLYYNTYIVPHCYRSGLMQSFSKHLIDRLNITQELSDPETVRVTLLKRTTRHRRINNEDELVKALKTVGYFTVNVVDYRYKEFPFLDQVKSSHNSDIFIGMHGSGLTHLIFLPDWAAVWELYNTEDEKCYKDLARLRGVEYLTWRDKSKMWHEREGLHPQMGTPHAKFTNYSFDLMEFMKLALELGDKVRSRKISYHVKKIFSSKDSF